MHTLDNKRYGEPAPPCIEAPCLTTLDYFYIAWIRKLLRMKSQAIMEEVFE